MFEEALKVFMELDVPSRLIIYFIVGCAIFFSVTEYLLSRKYAQKLKAGDELAAWLKRQPEKLNDQLVTPLARQIVQANFLHDTDLAGNRSLKKDEAGKYLITTSPETLISSIPASPYRFVPALLTTAGVLGTFWGISIGLSSFNPGDNSDALMKSATLLLGGMKTAFFTSLVGMLFSLVFMIWLAVNVKIKQKSRDRVASNLSNHCSEINGLMLLHDLAPSNQDELVGLQVEAAKSNIESNKSLLSSLEKIDESLSKSSPENFALIVSDAIRKVVENSLNPVISEISAELKVLRDIKEKSSEEIIEQMIEQMRRVVMEPLNATIAEMSERMQQGSNTFDVRMTEQAQWLEKLLRSTEILSDFQSDTLSKLQAFSQSLDDTLKQFRTQTSAVMSQVAEEIQTAMGESIQGMKIQREAFEQSARHATEVFTEQNKAMENIGQQSTKLMSDARDNLLSGLADLDKKVLSMSEVVQSELERFRTEYQSNLVKFFDTQSELLDDVLSKQKDGLTQTVEMFRDVFHEEHQLREKQLNSVAEQYNEMVNGVRLIENLVEAVGMTESAIFSQLEDASDSVSKQVGILRKEYESASKMFKALTERMPEAMNEYFDSANESHENFFSSFDEAAAKVHGRLAEAANMLVTAMQQIELQLGVANQEKDVLSARESA